LEDAIIVAKALRDSPDLNSAFVLYERLRRNSVQANIDHSARVRARHRLKWPQLPPARLRIANLNDVIDTQLQWHTPLD